MPGYSSSLSRYRSAYRRRRVYRRAARRYFRRNKLPKAINTSTRSRITVNFPCHTAVTFTQNANSSHCGIGVFRPLQCTESGTLVSLLGSAVFRSYCSLYEEMKIDSVYVKICCVTPIGNTFAYAGKLVTAWCRHCGTNEDPWRDIQTLTDSNTSKTKTFVQNSVVRTSRAIYASDFSEKTTFMSTNISFSGGTNAYYLPDYHNREEPECFSPALGMTFMAHPIQDQARNFTFLLDFYINVTFRGPHYGTITSGSNYSSGAKEVQDDSTAPVRVSREEAESVMDGARVSDPDLDADEMPESITVKKVG